MIIAKRIHRGVSIQGKIIALLVILTLFSPLIITGSSIKNPEFEHVSKFESNNENEIIKNAEQLIVNAPPPFIENRGQLKNDEVRFYDQDGSVWFTDDGVWFELREEIKVTSRESGVESHESRLATDDYGLTTYDYKRLILKQEFTGANRLRPRGKEQLSYYSNFFYGNDSSKWCTEVPNYQEVYYENIYDGIDLRYYLSQNGLKYDLIVHPKADPGQIRIRWDGVDSLEMNDRGDIIIKTPSGNLIDGAPFIFQDFTGSTQQVIGTFKIINEMEYGFEILDNYNKHEILVIDPDVELEYSTYLGGTDVDSGNSIAADSLGNAYVTGRTKSSNFPTSTGAYNESYNTDYDVFVTKLNPSASDLGYSTFIGGDEDDIGYSIKVDSTGNVFATGETESSDFPVTNGAYDTVIGTSYSDVFILKLSSDGSALSYSTFVGGNNDDIAYDIAIDINGNAFVVGKASSTDFPTSIGAYDDSYNRNRDCFVLKLNQTGKKLIYSTYLGGDSSDYGYGIDIDPSGNAYVTGYTSSDDFPTSINAFSRTIQGNQFEIFVSKLNNLGSDIIYSTFVGGTGTDIAYSIKVDSEDNAYVAGWTRSSNFPITDGVYDDSYGGGTMGDCIVFKLNETGSKLIFSTYIGNSSDDNIYDLALDSIGNVYITGDTRSSNFPVTPDAYQSSRQSSRDGFISKLSGDGANLIYSSYLGGDDDDYCKSITSDPNGNVYVTGYTESSDFPNTPGVINRTYNGLVDAFVTKFSFEPFISIPSVLLLRNETPINITHSQLCPYTFKVNVIDSVSKTDLKDVYLTLDPLGTNIQLCWNRSSGQFTKLGDPNNYILIDPSSKVDNLLNIWSIYFNVIFNWSYPNEKFHNVQAFTSSMTLPTSWFNITEMYRVENDLVFNGTLKVTDENKHIINDNDLIRGEQLLNWNGLTMVYENTTDVFPPTSICKISLWDEIGNSWQIPTAEGEMFNIEIFAPTSTYLTGFNYTINISGVPLKCDATNEIFTIRVDGNNVTFSNPSPNNTAWQTNNKVIVSVDITDLGGGQVNHSTVQQSISIKNGTIWGYWKAITGLKSETSIIVQDVIALDEGINNLVKWKAADSVGNGPTESKPYRILVDTEGVEFSNAWPMSNDISLSEIVEVGITISDKTSGVNASIIEYSISEDNGKNWNFWKKVEGLNDSVKIDVQMNITVPNGTNNMLKWRATDIAGNDIVESPPLAINVNTWTPPITPEITIISPLNGITINTTTVNLTWELIDPNIKNVTFDIFFDVKNPPDMLRSEVINASYRIDDLKDGETYYWRIISYKDKNLENSFKSDILWFKVELPIEKIYRITIMGPEIISLYQGERTNVSLTITNLGTNDDTINVKIQESNISQYIQLNDYSYLLLSKGNFGIRTLMINVPEDAQPGKYEITVIAISINSDEKVKSNHIITLEIKEINGDGGDQDGGPQDKGANLSNLMLILLIIIIIIIILSVLFLVLKKKKREAEKLSTGTSFTTKPLPTQVISIGKVKQQAIQPTQTVIPSATLQPQVVTTYTLPTVAQQPSVSTTETLSQIPSIIQTAQTPLLPPAKIPSTSNEPLPVSPEIPTPTLKPKVAPETPVTYATPVIKPN